MTKHIDTLAEWWENAETGRFREGDSLIFKYGDEYTVQPAYEDGEISRPDEERILHRAPAPKPAWHDAVAVIARCSNAPEDHREPFIRSDATPDVWIGEAGYGYTEDLRDVTPLIEQKATDEMVDRLRDAVSDHSGKVSRDDIRAWVRAALGLDPA